MKTKFSIKTYFDPYGDGKSVKREFSRMNYYSSMSTSDVEDIIRAYNQGRDYYSQVSVASFDRRRKNIANFDTSFYLLLNFN